MITLLTYAAAFGEPAASPFCVKAIWLLNLSGQDWQREDLADPRKMPHQKLPAIRVNGQIIPDSDNIRAHLEENGADFDASLTDTERAISRAFIRMAEEHMYFHIVMDRWGDDRVWPIIRNTYFKMIPRILRKVVTNKLRKECLRGMNGQGLGRFNEAQRLARIEPDLAAVAQFLGDKPFLFGDTPTAADASVAAMVSNLASTPFPTALQQRVANDPVLTNYVQRCSVAMGTA